MERERDLYFSRLRDNWIVDRSGYVAILSPRQYKETRLARKFMRAKLTITSLYSSSEHLFLRRTTNWLLQHLLHALPCLSEYLRSRKERIPAGIHDNVHRGKPVLRSINLYQRVTRFPTFSTPFWSRSPPLSHLSIQQPSSGAMVRSASTRSKMKQHMTCAGPNADADTLECPKPPGERWCWEEYLVYGQLQPCELS